MKRRPYTDEDPMPHGTREVARYLITDLPDMRGGRIHRSYGRRQIAREIRGCERCRAVDARDARLTRMHTHYARRR